MVNGRIAQEMPTAQLAADRGLQERLLGVRSGGADDETEAPATDSDAPEAMQVLTVRRAHADGAPSMAIWRRTRCAASTAGTRAAARQRWSISRAPLRPHPNPHPRAAVAVPWQAARWSRCPSARAPTVRPTSPAPSIPRAASCSSCANAWSGSPSRRHGRSFHVGKPSTASVHPREVARHHPQGEAAVFSDDRGRATAAMATAFEAFVKTAAISAASSRPAARAAPRWRARACAHCPSAVRR